MAHPKYELPKTPHAEYRYKMAMKHVEAAKAAGKSSEEIHEIFHKVMNYDIISQFGLPLTKGTILIKQKNYLCLHYLQFFY